MLGCSSGRHGCRHRNSSAPDRSGRRCRSGDFHAHDGRPSGCKFQRGRWHCLERVCHHRLWFGGLVAGRLSGCPHSGFVHGVLVWNLTVILTLLLLSMGTGLALGGAMKILGEGLGIGGKAVSAGVGDLAKAGAKRSADQLGSFIDEAVQSVPTNATPKAGTRARREVGFAVIKLFAPGNDPAFPANRTAAIQALMVYTEMSAADATKTIDDWT